MLKIRAKEHRNPSSAKGIYYYINSCPTYLSKLKVFEDQNINPNSGSRAKKKEIHFLCNTLEFCTGDLARILNVVKLKLSSFVYSDQT